MARNNGLICAAKLTAAPAAGSSIAASSDRGASAEIRLPGGPAGPQSQRGTGHISRRTGAGLGVLHRDPRAPLDVGGKSGPKFGVGRQPGFIGGLAEQAHPPRPLGLGQRLADVFRHHVRVAAVLLGVRLRAAEGLTQPGRDALGMIGGHIGKERLQQGVLGDLLFVEEARHPGQGR